MKKQLLQLSILGLMYSCQVDQQEQILFNGEDFNGWEGDTINVWRIEDHAMVAGSLTERAPRNDFICTTKSFENFILTFKFKLEGTEGFVNAGVQIRSERIDNPPHEMSGYQADIGPGYYGKLYDESRRNKILAGLDSLAVSEFVRHGDWNEYRIEAQGPNIKLYINDRQTVNYTETDSTIEQTGVVGMQIHGGGMTKISYKDIHMKLL